MKVNQISIFVENKSGQLMEVTKTLADAGINLKALNIAETTEYGIVRIIADDEKKAVDTLIKEGFIISVNPVTTVAVPDVAGGLNAVLEKISAANINIEYMYSIFGGEGKDSEMVIKTNVDIDAIL